MTLETTLMMGGFIALLTWLIAYCLRNRNVPKSDKAFLVASYVLIIAVATRLEGWWQ